MEYPFLLRSSEKSKKAHEGKPETSDRTKTSRERYYLCVSCFNRITTDRFRSEVMGSFSHNFTNPAGINFDIICFSTAKGCNMTGIPSMEFTWFPGYSWCYAYCNSCKTHLGWFYRSPEDSFFGLIKNRLRSDTIAH
ncbi:MAG: cereblon family protein [Acidobacteriota bacterium]